MKKKKKRRTLLDGLRIGDEVRRRYPKGYQGPRDLRVFEVALPSYLGKVDVEFERDSGVKFTVKIPRVALLLCGATSRSDDSAWVELWALLRDFELVST